MRYLVRFENRTEWSNEYTPEEVDAFVVSINQIQQLTQQWSNADGEPVALNDLMEQVDELEDGAIYLACHDWLSRPIAASANADKDSLLYAIGIDTSSQEDLESAYCNYPFVYADDEGNYCVDYDNLYIV